MTARRLISVQHTTPTSASCPRIPTSCVRVRRNILLARWQHSALGTSCAISRPGSVSACSALLLRSPAARLPVRSPDGPWATPPAPANAAGCGARRGVGHAYARAGAGGGLTSAHVRGRVAAGSAGRLLDVVRALATTAAQGVRLVVTLTEACGTLAYNLRARTRQPPAAHSRAPQLPRRCCAGRTERRPAPSPIALRRLDDCATRRCTPSPPLCRRTGGASHHPRSPLCAVALEH